MELEKKPSVRLLKVFNQRDAVEILGRLGVDSAGVRIMSSKMRHAVIYVKGVQARGAHIVKQIMLSKGGECATPRDVFFKNAEPVDIIMMGTLKQLRRAAGNFSTQPFGLSKLAEELKNLLAREFPAEAIVSELTVGSHTIRFGERTLIMGVLNVTPDSFSDGGHYFERESALRRAYELVEEGADIIDIGGESTRPGADPVSMQEEIERTIPIIECVASRIGVPVSIDTYKSEVAKRALDAGAVMVNDISGLRFDPEMIPLLARRRAVVVIMHMKGTPRDMQKDPKYDDLLGEISSFLERQALAAIEGGIEADRIVIDPGIGFGKTVDHNLEIMRRLEEFKSLGFPLLVGTSRKSFIGAVLDKPVEERIWGTAATVSFAVSGGADIVRVHDVREMVQVVRMTEAMREGRQTPADEESQ